MADDLGPIFDAAAQEWNVHPALLRAVAGQESGGTRNPDQALSPKGAQGRMQLMPKTAIDLGVTDTSDPTQNIYGGAKYLSQMLDRYKTPELALAAYNAGPGRVDDYIAGKSSLPAETVAYVPGIARRFQALTAPQQAGAPQQADALPVPPVTPPAPAADTTAAPAPANDPFSRAMGAPPQQAANDPFSSAVAEAQAATPSTAPTDQATKDALQQLEMTPDASTLQTSLPPLSLAPVGRVLSAVGGNAAKAFGLEPFGVSNATADKLAKAGVFPDQRTGAGGFWQNAAEAAIRPVAALGDFALRTGSAAIGGLQAGIAQTGEEVGAPLLGRDIAAGIEAFPFGFHGGVPKPPGALTNKLAAPAPPGAVPMRTIAAEPMMQGVAGLDRSLPEANQLTGSPMRAANDSPGVVQFPGNRLAESRAVTSEPLPAPVAEPTPPVTPPVTPQAGTPILTGAPATKAPPTSTLPIVTQAQASNQVDRILGHFGQGGNMVPSEAPVAGSPSTLAQATGNAGIAALENSLRMTDPHFNNLYTAQAAVRAEQRGQAIKTIAGTSDDIDMREAARDASTSAARDAVFADTNTTPVDAAPVTQKIKDILASPEGKRDAVVRSLTPFLDKLKTSDGTGLEADPQQLYGVRKAINDRLDSVGTQEGADAKAATRQLMDVRNALDTTIESGAPGFGDYIKSYSEQSRPIDAMRFLQAQNITDQLGRIQLSKLDSTVKRLEAQQAKPGASLADSVTPDQIQALRTVRDDMRREAAINATKPLGSNTVQMLGTNKLLSGMKGATDAAGIAGMATLGTTGAAAIPVRLGLNTLANRGNALVQQELRNRLLNPAVPTPSGGTVSPP